MISGSSVFSEDSFLFKLVYLKVLSSILFKPSLKDFEHYLANMGNESNCVIVWTWYGIAFLWDWNENWPFPVLWPLLSSQIYWHIDCSTLRASGLLLNTLQYTITQPKKSIMHKLRNFNVDFFGSLLLLLYKVCLRFIHVVWINSLFLLVFLFFFFWFSGWYYIVSSISHRLLNHSVGRASLLLLVFGSYR